MPLPACPPGCPGRAANFQVTSVQNGHKDSQGIGITTPGRSISLDADGLDNAAKSQKRGNAIAAQRVGFELNLPIQPIQATPPSLDRESQLPRFHWAIPFIWPFRKRVTAKSNGSAAIIPFHHPAFSIRLCEIERDDFLIAERCIHLSESTCFHP